MASTWAVTEKPLTYGVIKVTVTIDEATNGANADFTLPRAKSISFQTQAPGDFSTKTVSLQAAPDGVNYRALPTAVSHVASAISSVALADCAFYHYRINVSTGTGIPLGSSITVTIIANQDI